MFEPQLATWGSFWNISADARWGTVIPAEWEMSATLPEFCVSDEYQRTKFFFHRRAGTSLGHVEV